MATENIGGTHFDEYLQGAINALLFIEPRTTDYKNIIGDGNLTIEFKEGYHIPLSVFMNLCKFIDSCGVNGDLYISPNSDNKVTIKFLYDEWKTKRQQPSTTQFLN